MEISPIRFTNGGSALNARMVRVKKLMGKAADIAGYFIEDMDVSARLENYYGDSEDQAPVWCGKVASKWGIQGKQVEAEEFCQLLNGYAPDGTSFVQSRKANRRLAYDIVVACPKSVSIMSLFDPRIREAFRDADTYALKEIEERAATRLRKGSRKRDEDWQSGALCYTRGIEHSSSREDDIHLHRHHIAVNISEGPDGKMYALSAQAFYERQRMMTEIFRNRLAGNLRGLGYEIRDTKKGMELVGVSDDLIKRFSDASAKIEKNSSKAAAKRGRELSDKEKAKLAHDHKSDKSHMDKKDFVQRNLNKFTVEEYTRLARLVPTACTVETSSESDAASAVTHALDFIYERAATTKTYHLAEQALIAGRGKTSWEEIKKQINKTGLVRDCQNVTTVQHVHDEQELLEFTKMGAGKCPPLAPRGINLEGLTPTQARMAFTVAQSRCAVTIIEGSPGAGKSYSIKALASAIPGLILTAPTGKAVDVLIADELPAQTLEQFVRKPTPGAKVVLVDEASLVDTQLGLRLVRLAKEKDLRIILCGDAMQNRPVGAGDFFQLLITHASRSATMTKLDVIERQKNTQYKRVVQLMVDGKDQEADALLDEMDAFVYVEDYEERLKAIANEYSAALKRGTVSCSAKTWQIHYDAVPIIREALVRDGLLGGEEHTFETFKRVDMTIAERKNEKLWDPQGMVQVTVDHEDIPAGTYGQFCGVYKRKEVGIKVGDTILHVPVAKMQPVEVHQTKVRTGERILLQANDKEAGVKNGKLDTVVGVQGRKLVMESGKVIDTETYKTWCSALVRTSLGCQGESTDTALVIPDGMSKRNKFVSYSRGKHAIKVFADAQVRLTEEEVILATDVYENSHRRISTGQPTAGQRQLQLLRHLSGGRTASRTASRTPGVPTANGAGSPYRIKMPARDGKRSSVQRSQNVGR